jgi:hypothetical protein
VILLVHPFPKIYVLIKSYHIAVIVLPLEDKVMIQKGSERNLLCQNASFFQCCNILYYYHQILQKQWCGFTIINVLAPTKHKNNDKNDSFPEQSESICDQFPWYHTTALLADFTQKVRGNRNDTEPANVYTLFCQNENEIIKWRHRFSYIRG